MGIVRKAFNVFAYVTMPVWISVIMVAVILFDVFTDRSLFRSFARPDIIFWDAL